jgi:murein DD-endopeptidase MepM/ murein hydrolase activator NlpD
VFRNSETGGIKIFNDGDYNAYNFRPTDDNSWDNLNADNADNYKSESARAQYADILGGQEQIKDMTYEEKGSLDGNFANETVHNELLSLYGFDEKLSITNNAVELMLSGTLDETTQKRLANAIKNGADDYTLLNIIANNTTNALVDRNIILNKTPFELYTNMFGLKASDTDYGFNDTSALSDKRYSGGGSGAFQANRTDSKTGGSYPHDGIDMLVPAGSPIYASNSGNVIISSTKKEGGLPIVKIKSENSSLYYNTSATLYVSPIVGDTQKVRQGQLIGYSVDLSGHYPSNVPNHVHFRIESDDYNHDGNRNVTDPVPHVFDTDSGWDGR